MDRLLLAVNQLQLTVSNPRPPETPNNSFASPLGRIRNRAAKAATAGVTGGGSVSALSLLVPSNSNGRDDRGYSVPSKHSASEMVRDFTSIPLGRFGPGRTVDWLTAANWRPLSQQFDKSQINRNIEGKKFMELFAYIATDEELTKITAPPHEDPTALAAVIDARRTATDAVVGRLMLYLTEHEKFLPKTTESTKSGAPKSSNVGALFSRWKVLSYPKRDANAAVDMPKSILPWKGPATATALAANAISAGAIAAGTDGSGSTDTGRKRRRASSKA